MRETYFQPLNSRALFGDGAVSYTVLEDSRGYDLADMLKFRDPKTIEKILARKDIYPRFRLCLIHPDSKEKTEIPLRDIEAGASYSENYQNGTRRTLSFSLNNEFGNYTPSINGIWATSYFSLESGFADPVSGFTILFPAGIYSPKSISLSREPGSHDVSIECSDKFSVLEGPLGVFQEAIEFKTGTVIEDIIRDVLGTDTGCGYVIDSTPFFYHPQFKGKKLPYTLSASAGSTMASLLNDIATILSAEIYYNEIGRLCVVPIVETITDYSKPSLFAYSAEKDGKMASNNLSLDIGSYTNAVYVVGSKVDGKTFVAKAVNNNPRSPINISRIGYRYAAPINDTNIVSQYAAQERADYELRKIMIAQGKTSCSLLFNPLLTVNNVIKITDPYYSYKNERFLLQSVSYNINYEGSMSVSVTNINDLPFIA